MQTDIAAPKPEAATVITTTIHAPPVPESKSSMLDALFGPKRSAVALYVHPKDHLTGRRLPAIMVIAQDEDAEVTATRLATLKPGSYDLIEKHGTEIVSTRVHVVEDIAAAVQPAPQPAAAQQGGMGDIAGVLKSLLEAQAAAQRESSREVREMMQAQQTAALAAQLEMMKELVKVQRQPTEKINDTLLLAILNRQQQDPIEMLTKMKQLDRDFKADAEPPREPGMMNGLASALAALAPLAMQQNAPAAPQPRPLRVVQVAPGQVPTIATAAAEPMAAAAAAAAGGEGDGGDGAPPPVVAAGGEGGDGGGLQALAVLLTRMAWKKVPADQAYGTLALLLDEGQMAQLLELCVEKMAVPLLIGNVPALQPHRAWVVALETYIRDLQATPAPPSTDGASHAASQNQDAA